MRSQFQFSRRRSALKRHNKADLIAEIRQSFYSDPNCTVLSTEAMTELASLNRCTIPSSIRIPNRVPVNVAPALPETKRSTTVAPFPEYPASYAHGAIPQGAPFSNATQAQFSNDPTMSQLVQLNRMAAFRSHGASSLTATTSPSLAQHNRMAAFRSNDVFSLPAATSPSSTTTPSSLTGVKRGRLSHTSSPSSRVAVVVASHHPAPRWSDAARLVPPTRTIAQQPQTASGTAASMPSTTTPQTSAATNLPANAAQQLPTTGSVTTGDPESTPQNALESRLMDQLLQTGFQNRREILVSIRKLVAAGTPEAATGSAGGPSPPSPSLTCDMVMCEILTAREEAEFAREMDRARLLSERDRRADAEERRKQIASQLEEKLLKSTLTQWLECKDMFKGSWLLQTTFQTVISKHVTQSKSTLKTKLMALLKLEKQSRKWYGPVLPRAYFEDELAPRLCAVMDANLLEAKIEAETTFLNEGLALLTNQQGMVPRLFVQAHDAAKQRAGIDGPNNDDDDDDEVVVLDTLGLPDNCSPTKKARAAGQGLLEAIEIS